MYRERTGNMDGVCDPPGTRAERIGPLADPGRSERLAARGMAARRSHRLERPAVARWRNPRHNGASGHGFRCSGTRTSALAPPSRPVPLCGERVSFDATAPNAASPADRTFCRSSMAGSFWPARAALAFRARAARWRRCRSSVTDDARVRLVANRAVRRGIARRRAGGTVRTCTWAGAGPARRTPRVVHRGPADRRRQHAAVAHRRRCRCSTCCSASRA